MKPTVPIIYASLESGLDCVAVELVEGHKAIVISDRLLPGEVATVLADLRSHPVASSFFATERTSVRRSSTL